MKRRITALALAVALIIGVSVVLSTRISAVQAPTLFHNDERWYRDASVPMEVISGICYVPVDVFGMFSSIELSMDSRRGEFMVYNRSTRSYISVLYNDKMASVNGKEEVYLNLYQLHGGYYYVPAEYFCSVLSLEYEVRLVSNAPSGMVVRISDAGKTMSLDELLAPYPADSVTTGEGTGTDTAPPVTGGQDATERDNYLFFYGISPNDHGQILDALAVYRVKATFFFTREELQKYPQTVIATVSAGHEIGIRVETVRSGESVRQQAVETNTLLYSIVKKKTRLLRLPIGTALSGEESMYLARAGFVVWGETYDVPIGRGYDADELLELSKNAIQSRVVNVLCIREGSTVRTYLANVLAFMLGNSGYRVLAASPCTVAYPPSSK